MTKPSDLAGPSERNLAVRVTPDAVRQVRAGHPWVFDGSIRSVKPEGGGTAGDLAVVFDDDRRFLAVGLWDPGSPIRIKVLHHGSPRTVDRYFWRERLSAAIAIRAELAARGTPTGTASSTERTTGCPAWSWIDTARSSS